MDRFVAGDRPPSSPKRSKMLACVDPAFDRAVVLFQDVVKILHRSMPAILLQSLLGFESHDSRWITGVLRGPARPGGAVPKGVERRVRESVGRSIRIRRVWRTTRCFRVSGSLAPVGVSSTRREQPESTVASRKRRLRKQFIKAAQVVPFCSPDAQTQLTAIKISFSISLVCAYKDS